MSKIFKERTLEFQTRMLEANIDVMLLMDPDSIYYFTAYWGDLGVEFGRPSIVAIPRNEEPTIITSSIEGEMCKKMTRITKIELYHDSVGKEWIDPLDKILEKCDEHLVQVVEIMGIKRVVGVGKYAEKRALKALKHMNIEITSCWHPSPASPLANRNKGEDWKENIKNVLPKNNHY